jgi:hypothetical protein
VLGSGGPQLQVLFCLNQSFWCKIEANDAGVRRCLRDCPHIVDPTRILEPVHRRSADRIGPSRKGAAALAPPFSHGVSQARSVRSSPSRLRVTGYRLRVASWELWVGSCGLGVAGCGLRVGNSPLLTPALLFAFCFPARRGHELWSNRIRNRLLQDTIDFNIVLGGQLPSVCFFHTLQLFG